MAQDGTVAPPELLGVVDPQVQVAPPLDEDGRIFTHEDLTNALAIQKLENHALIEDTVQARMAAYVSSAILIVNTRGMHALGGKCIQFLFYPTPSLEYQPYRYPMDLPGSYN